MIGCTTLSYLMLVYSFYLWRFIAFRKMDRFLLELQIVQRSTHSRLILTISTSKILLTKLDNLNSISNWNLQQFKVSKPFQVSRWLRNTILLLQCDEALANKHRSCVSENLTNFGWWDCWIFDLWPILSTVPSVSNNLADLVLQKCSKET